MTELVLYVAGLIAGHGFEGDYGHALRTLVVILKSIAVALDVAAHLLEHLIG